MQRFVSILGWPIPAFKPFWISYLFLLISYLITTNLYPCTIFYSSQNGIILAGNNEDWKDPNTKMWFYPSTDSTYGWVKFGFESGFPQGGMNDQGLFWDGTSNPYLAMPDAEANKILFDGPLMQKVITESASVMESLEIFNHYYCADQYRAQYLLGDSTGNSMIVEGDNVLFNENGFQVLTNFYQSYPDLGGYPCWRYETAVEHLQDCDSLTTWFAEMVLASTHQDGNYPTQYSNIYDLKNGIIYLFYYHNFEEYLVINLQDELEKGYKTYAIPKIFSKIKIQNPLISDTKVTFKWKGLPDSQYEVLLSKNPDFTKKLITNFNSFESNPTQSSIPVLILSFIFILTFLILLRKQKTWYLIPLIFGVCLLVNCDKEETTPEETDNSVEFSKIIDGLEPESTYYWKIKALTGSTDHFFTETATQSFKTLSQ